MKMPPPATPASGAATAPLRPYMRTHGKEVARLHLFDWIVLLLLVAIYAVLGLVEPFHRFVAQDMMAAQAVCGLGYADSLIDLSDNRVIALHFDYNFSSSGVLAGANLSYVGDSSPSGDRISVTKPANWSSGVVAHAQPVRLWQNTSDPDEVEVASFTTTFSVVISPVNNNTNQGDGMAFFIGPYPAIIPPDSPGGFLALFSNPYNQSNTYFAATVGVELDSYRNEMWDPKDAGAHIGIDVNSIKSRAYVPAPAPSLRGTITAWVTYNASTSTLAVTVRFDDLPGKPSRDLAAKLDLRKSGFPQDAAVGFSAATGNYIEQHQILSWSFDSGFSNRTGAVAPDGGASQKKPQTTIGLIAGTASAGMLTVLCITALLCYLRYSRRKCSTSRSLQQEFEKGTGPRRFSYRELSRATRGFSDTEKLGEGGFGSVYRGFLHAQRLHVAVKRVSKGSKQGRREYITEVTTISRLRHRNLVELVGWCHDGDELLLVYELMANGSLDTHLHGSRSILPWTIRYNAILALGSALLYLHEECEKYVLHRDIKPSNVMLDSSFNAKLGDFGLARLMDHSRRQRTTALAGTLGYIDPECVVTSRASAQSDMYSFGVLLHEVACGRRPVVPEEDESKVRLIDWVWDLHGSGRLLDAADERLGGEFDARQMEHVLLVGLWCVHPDYGLRPSVRQAMSVLQFEAPLPELPPEMPLVQYHNRSDYTSQTGSSGEGVNSSSCPTSASRHSSQGTRSFGTANTQSLTMHGERICTGSDGSTF